MTKKDSNYNSTRHIMGIAVGIFTGGGLGAYLGDKNAVIAGILIGYVAGEILGLMYKKSDK